MKSNLRCAVLILSFWPLLSMTVAFGNMIYPNDVTNYPPNWMYSGSYSWVCVVRGHVVAQGKFSITYPPHGEQLRTADPF